LSQSEPSGADELASSFGDHQAAISHLAGSVRILRADSEEWAEAKENDSVAEGDQIKTSNGASCDILYDDSSLNIVHVDENSIVTFLTIEPTYLYLMDGSIFNSLEGLPDGEQYEVSTETATTGIRGTKFLRTYLASEQSDSTIVSEGTVESFPVLADGSLSQEAVRIQKDNELTLTPEMLRSTPISGLRPVPATPEHRGRLEHFSNGVETRLEKFAGGREQLNQKREQARAAMRAPGFRIRFQAQAEAGSDARTGFQQRASGPMGRKGGPSFGGKPGGLDRRGPGGKPSGRIARPGGPGGGGPHRGGPSRRR
jgi:hypothetical protein